mgnify:CR=1 FL=1
MVIMKIKLHLGYSGFCFAKANHAVSGDEKKKIKFHSLYGLILHPIKGWVLFDTGYTKRFYQLTNKYPNKIYSKLTRVHVENKDEIILQLSSFGIKPSDVKHIIISHFHADHIGGLMDFKNAKYYCSQSAYEQVKTISDYFAFSKGILKGLIPNDFEDRLIFIEKTSNVLNDSIFSFKYDLFNDNSIIVYNLPGHAAGQVGIEVQTSKFKYFLVSDSCWDRRAFENFKLPSSIVRLFIDSWSDYRKTLNKINQYHNRYSEVNIIPSHCRKTTANFVNDTIQMDVL